MREEIAYEIWCLWNSKRMPIFVFEYLLPFVNPIRFQEKYWKQGLQRYWLKFQSIGGNHDR